MRLGIDLRHQDPDAPIGELRVRGALQSAVRWILGIVTERGARSMRVVAGYVAMNLRLVGTREQIADRLAEWCAAWRDEST